MDLGDIFVDFGGVDDDVGIEVVGVVENVDCVIVVVVIVIFVLL